MRLLLVEDKDSFRRLLVQALEGSGWTAAACAHPGEALEALAREPFDAMITDLRLPGFSGLELLKRAKRLQPALRTVLMSAFGEPQDIVEAVRWGADDFLAKPFDLERFLELLARLRALSDAPPPDPREPWIAFSPALRALDQALLRAAEGCEPAWFQGPSGSGKLRAARRLHTLRNPGAPFGVVEAEAFATQQHRLPLLADGTLCLVGLHRLPESHAPRLLQAMESPEGRRVAWMATTREGVALPPSLAERLGVLRFALPPLEERREDVLPLFRSFITSEAQAEGRTPPVVERVHERELLARNWPGNARELAWCAREALRATQGAVLGPLPNPSSRDGDLVLPWPPPGPLTAMADELAHHAEAALLRRALERHLGDATATAAALGLTVRALGLRLKEHGIPLPE